MLRSRRFYDDADGVGDGRDGRGCGGGDDGRGGGGGGGSDDVDGFLMISTIMLLCCPCVQTFREKDWR